MDVSNCQLKITIHVQSASSHSFLYTLAESILSLWNVWLKTAIFNVMIIIITSCYRNWYMRHFNYYLKILFVFSISKTKKNEKNIRKCFIFWGLHTSKTFIVLCFLVITIKNIIKFYIPSIKTTQKDSRFIFSQENSFHL